MKVIPLRRPPGRPQNPVVDPATLKVLSIQQSLAYCRSLGRGISRERFLRVILTGQCPALEDTSRLDRFGKPRLLVRRVDLEQWLASTLKPFSGIG